MFYTAQSGLKQHTRHTSTLDLLVLWTRSEEAADRWFRVLEAARRYQLAMAEEEEEWVGVLLGGRRDDVDTPLRRSNTHSIIKHRNRGGPTYAIQTSKCRRMQPTCSCHFERTATDCQYLQAILFSVSQKSCNDTRTAFLG